ncbi:MAG TPA: SGNH/GDSL hydrolase family protein [Polyangiaceae bacterium]|nr:SGNH/GDSL hydrolase family protein [Polyangiaceae bacterium]
MLRAIGALSLLSLLLLPACSSSESSGNANGGRGGVSGAGGNGGSGGASTCAAPPSLGVRWVGRVDGCDPRGARYAWSGSGFVGRFSGTGLGVRLLDAGQQHTVLIDGALQPTLKTQIADAMYPLASGLPQGEHTFEVYRRTEASFGETIVASFAVTGGELLSPPEPPARRIEVVGDSITCGYGNEGTLPCMFSADTENHYLSYAAIAARDLGAELSTVAWSGKGVVFNYNGDPNSPLPTLYSLSSPTDRESTWSFAWQPDAVVINLGTNDYSTGKNPTDAMFVEAYTGLLARIRGVYPKAFVLCTMGPLLNGSGLATARKNISGAVEARHAAGDQQVKYFEFATPNGMPPGCDYHPNLATHDAMAKELAAELRADLSW